MRDKKKLLIVQKLKENKKRGIALGLVAVVAIGGAAVKLTSSQSSVDASEEEASATDLVEKQAHLEKTSSVTGTITSANSTTENAGVTASYPVESVNVKVGDTVHAGDVLYTLDMSTVESDIATQQATKAAQNTSDQSAISAANRQVSEAVSAANFANAKAASDVSNAQSDLDAAQTALNNANTTLAAAQTAEANALNAYNSASEDQKASLKADYDTAVSNRQAAEEAAATAQTNLTTAQRTLSSAQSDQSSTAASGNSSVASSQDAVNSARNSASTSNLTTDQAITKDQEELAKKEVRASMDGTVTNVNVSVGQSYSGTGGVVISNTDNLVASANVDESIISQITTGMKVYIKTEATGDEELTGTVSFVSPTATKNSGASGDATSSDASTSDGTGAVSTTRATYRVDVTLDEANSDLRLGMTAKMNFVLASADNVLVVPTADITTSGDESFVTVLKNGKETEVPVEVGIANDYYTVIQSDDIKEGDEVLMVTDLGSDEEDSEDLLMGAY